MKRKCFIQTLRSGFLKCDRARTCDPQAIKQGALPTELHTPRTQTTMPLFTIIHHSDNSVYSLIHKKENRLFKARRFKGLSKRSYLMSLTYCMNDDIQRCSIRRGNNHYTERYSIFFAMVLHVLCTAIYRDTDTQYLAPVSSKKT